MCQAFRFNSLISGGIDISVIRRCFMSSRLPATHLSTIASMLVPSRILGELFAGKINRNKPSRYKTGHQMRELSPRKTEAAIPRSVEIMVHFASKVVNRAYHRLFRKETWTFCTKLFFLPFICIVIAGCATARFYLQAVAGQMELLAKRQGIEELLLDTATTQHVRRQLESVQRILDFAQYDLFLPVDGQYREYVDLDREYLVWNVVAAEEFSVEAVMRCYPVAGCAPYRGYFNEDMALQEARRLQRKGYDVYVSGVPAYSTIGWFDDPIVSTFSHWDEPDLAQLLFHELAHSVLFVPGDSAFNEAFATFVGRKGGALYIQSRNLLGDFRLIDEEQELLFEWLLSWREELGQLYASEKPVSVLGELKMASFKNMQSCYQANKQVLGHGRFDAFMKRPFDNARMATIGTYYLWVPAFQRLFVENKEDWRSFFEGVETLAKLSFDERLQRLMELREEEVAQRGYNQSPDDIQCETFSNHPLDTKLSG